MFPSANFDNIFDQSLLKRPSFPSDQNPSSKQEEPPFLFNFPSPFFDEHESPLNQIFFQNHQMATDETDTNTDPPKNVKYGDSKLHENEADLDIPATVAPLRRRDLGVKPRRRTGKKDRHSKICTAQGIRDRRMRLSLHVARKFFDLQDMLGYDKASKTIEWLFTKSKKAINEMISDYPRADNVSTSTDVRSESFLSECEVVSGIEENTLNKNVMEGTVPAGNVRLSINPCQKDERKNQKLSSKTNTKDSREKARARARCRTREKMMIKRLEYPCQCSKPSPTGNENIQKLGSSNSCPFEGADQESNSKNQETVSSYEAAYSLVGQQLSDVGTIEKFPWNSSSLSASWPISDCHCSAPVSGYTDLNGNFMGFLGNWDPMNNDRTNSLHYSVTNQVPLAGNISSDYSVTVEFP